MTSEEMTALPTALVPFKEPAQELAGTGWTVADLAGLCDDWPHAQIGWLSEILALAQLIASITNAEPDHVRAWLRGIYVPDGVAYTESATTRAWVAAHGGDDLHPHDVPSAIIAAYTDAAGGDQGMALLALRGGLTVDEVVSMRAAGQINRSVLEALAGLRNW